MHTYQRVRWSNASRKEKILLILALAIVVVILVGVHLAGKDSGSKNSSSAANIGNSVHDGNFDFIVKNFKCGVQSVTQPDNDYLNKTAQGQYCVLGLTVKNSGNAQQPYYSRFQNLLDSSGASYGSDETATTYYAASNAPSTYYQLNPGSSVDASVVFDVPKDVTPNTAQLRDSDTSSGTKTSLY